jgi:hypothetical protein
MVVHSPQGQIIVAFSYLLHFYCFGSFSAVSGPRVARAASFYAFLAFFSCENMQIWAFSGFFVVLLVQNSKVAGWKIFSRKRMPCGALLAISIPRFLDLAKWVTC